MKDKSFYWLIAAIAIVIIVLAILAIRESNRNNSVVVPPVVNNNNGNTYIPPVVVVTPPAPVSVIGKTAFANEANVKVYYKSPFVVYKVAAYNEWLGVVNGLYGDYYSLTTGSGGDKIVNKTKARLL